MASLCKRQQCTIDRRGFRQELDSWRHKLIHCVGLNDREGRGRWEWAGGELVGYTNWRKTPTRAKTKGSRKCVLVWRRAKWQIRDCKTSRGHRFVCSLKT